MNNVDIVKTSIFSGLLYRRVDYIDIIYIDVINNDVMKYRRYDDDVLHIDVLNIDVLILPLRIHKTELM